MSFTNILVPYDGSDHAKEALREAMKMVEGNTDASIHVSAFGCFFGPADSNTEEDRKRDAIKINLFIYLGLNVISVAKMQVTAGSLASSSVNRT